MFLEANQHLSERDIHLIYKLLCVTCYGMNINRSIRMHLLCIHQTAPLIVIRDAFSIHHPFSHVLKLTLMWYVLQVVLSITVIISLYHNILARYKKRNLKSCGINTTPCKIILQLLLMNTIDTSLLAQRKSIEWNQQLTHTAGYVQLIF